MARSAKQVAAQRKAALASAMARKKRGLTSAAKKGGSLRVPAGAPKGAYRKPDTPAGAFITRESYGEQAWKNLAEYTKAKTPKPKAASGGSDWQEWKYQGWGMGSG